MLLDKPTTGSLRQKICTPATVLALTLLVPAIAIAEDPGIDLTEAEYQVQQAHCKLEQANQQLVTYVDIVDKDVITSSTDASGMITSTSEDETLAEKRCQAVADLDLEHEYNPVAGRVTISVGLKTHEYAGGRLSPAELILRRADEALYQARETGRNQFVRHGDPGELKKPVPRIVKTA